MTEAIPRLLIVEPTETFAALIRATFDLLGRRCRLVTASTALDAFDELSIRVPDLLITADRLTGDHPGTELASRAHESFPALPIILISDEVPVDPLLAGVTVLNRPVAPDMLWRSIRVALGEPVEAAPVVGLAVEDLGPVPAINPAQLQPILIRLLTDVGAVAAALADRTGLLLLSAGAPAYLNLPQIAALIHPAALSLAQLNSILGERLRTLNYFDGTRHDVFSLSVGLHHFLFLVFDSATGDRALGGVRRSGNLAVDDMLRSLGDSAYQLTPVEASQPVTAVPRITAPPVNAEIIEPRRSQRPPEPAPTPEPADPALLIAGLDLSVFDTSQLQDLNLADDPFAPDRIESIVSAFNADGEDSDGLIFQSSF